MRSPTAADVVADWDGYSADFAGLSRDADTHVTPEQVADVDLICVMEGRQRKRLTQLVRSAQGKRIVVLDVPDRYAYRAPELIALLTRRLARVV